VANQATAALDTDAGLPGLPSLGQVVSVRGSTWAVTDVRESLPETPGYGAPAKPTHVVSLQSLS
jgi:hypothetical protein